MSCVSCVGVQTATTVGVLWFVHAVVAGSIGFGSEFVIVAVGDVAEG